MNNWLFGGLIGLVAGLIIFPIFLSIFVLIRNTLERRKIKKLLKAGKFLITIDEKDYNAKAWEGQRYGNIDREKAKKDLDKLNEKIFKKTIDTSDDNFMLKVIDYVKLARKNGFTDDKIKEEFKKKSYADELITKIFEGL